MAPNSYLFSPQPLVEELIRPTTLEWISEEPENRHFVGLGFIATEIGRTESLLS